MITCHCDCLGPLFRVLECILVPVAQVTHYLLVGSYYFFHSFYEYLLSSWSNPTFEPCPFVCRASQVALVVKNLLASAGDLRDAGLIPRSGGFPGEGNGLCLNLWLVLNSIRKVFIHIDLLFSHWVMSWSFAILWTVACQAPLFMGFPR